MNYISKRKTAEKKSFLILGGVIFLAFALGILIVLMSPPEMADNFCPNDQSKIYPLRISVLVDATSGFTKFNSKVLDGYMQGWMNNAPNYQSLTIYPLNDGNINAFDSTDTLCTPPSDFLMKFTYGKKRADARKQLFRDRVLAAKKSTINSIAASDSRILEAVRQMTNSSQWKTGSSRLVLISDLMEKSGSGNFYSIAPDFNQWILNPNNAALISSIHIGKGDQVQICQLVTDGAQPNLLIAAHNFWISLFEYKKVKEVLDSCSN